MSSSAFRGVSHKRFAYKPYVCMYVCTNRIWHWITPMIGWYTIKQNQIKPNQIQFSGTPLYFSHSYNPTSYFLSLPPPSFIILLPFFFSSQYLLLLSHSSFTILLSFISHILSLLLLRHPAPLPINFILIFLHLSFLRTLHPPSHSNSFIYFQIFTFHSSPSPSLSVPLLFLSFFLSLSDETSLNIIPSFFSNLSLSLSLSLPVPVSALSLSLYIYIYIYIYTYMCVCVCVCCLAFLPNLSF